MDFTLNRFISSLAPPDNQLPELSEQELKDCKQNTKQKYTLNS